MVFNIIRESTGVNAKPLFTLCSNYNVLITSEQETIDFISVFELFYFLCYLIIFVPDL